VSEREETAHLATLKSKNMLVVNLLKANAEIENRNGRKVQLGPGKQTTKTWFGLEK
jgi:hypothetical protein